MLSQNWALKTHLPIDVLTPLVLTPQEYELLQLSEAWFLTSPTAAHCLALALNSAPAKLTLPSTLAFVGQASLDAWQAAGGPMVKRVLLSTTGESMGLFERLKQRLSVCMLRAQSGRDDLPNALRSHGVEVSSVAVYKKTPNPIFASSLHAAMQSAPNFEKAFCFTSSDQVARVLSASDEHITWLQATAWTSHPRVEALAKSSGFADVRLFQL